MSLYMSFGCRSSSFCITIAFEVYKVLSTVSLEALVFSISVLQREYTAEKGGQKEGSREQCVYSGFETTSRIIAIDPGYTSIPVRKSSGIIDSEPSTGELDDYCYLYSRWGSISDHRSSSWPCDCQGREGPMPC
jgi:hypothetical protein